MRRVALFAALCSIVVCEFFGNNTCQKFCHMQTPEKGQATNVSLRRALKSCCDEATVCVLPAHFYNFTCVKELMDVCLNFEKRSASNLTWRTQHLCCGNFNSNETGREFKGPCFKNISVDSNNETSQFFPTVRDQEPLFKWERKQWKFVLKMWTQTCLNSTAPRISLTPSSVKVKFKYPIFAKREIYEEKFVHGIYAPTSYLVMKKGDHDMLTILGESVKHLWVTLCICVTWTLISGVIIWLLVSLVICYVCSTSLVCISVLQSVGQSGEISTQAYNSFVKFCLLENAEQFTREVCEFCHKVVLSAGKSQH